MSSKDSTYEVGNIHVTYGIVTSVGAVALILVVVLSSLVCIRGRALWGSSSEAPTPLGNNGIDEGTLISYPKFAYSEREQSCCSICLGDYSEEDVVRLIPDCAHLFHMECIDAWLRMHATCPICRTSPLPTPLSDTAHSHV